MTTPSGARNAIASRSPRANDDDDDDAHAEDPKLRAMRAVWLTMRDEDPPSRGMAELLAAARVTAAAMQAHPTLWQRLVAGLRRPPALAFATLMVLVGGAVIVGRRDVEVPAARAPAASGVVAMEPAPPPAPSRPEVVAGNAVPGEGAPSPGETDGRGAVAGSAQLELADEHTRREKGPGKATEAVTGARRDGVRTGAVAVSAKPAPVVAKPGLERGPAGKATASADRKDFGVDSAADLDAAAPRGTAAPAPDAPATGAPDNAPGARPPRPEPMRESPRSAGNLDGAASTASNEPTAPTDTGEAAKQVRVDPTAARHDKEEHTAPGAPLAQLYQQCEAAARRGDCAAVRLMVDRIAKLDRDYRARVAKGSPVAKCLAK